MSYAFNKHKLPAGLSFPLKRSVLDAALADAQITQIVQLYYWRRHGGHIVMRADFCGEARQAWAAGQTTLTLYAVPAPERPATESLFQQTILPQLCAWLQQAEQMGRVWRGSDHSLVFQVTHGVLSVTST